MNSGLSAVSVPDELAPIVTDIRDERARQEAQYGDQSDLPNGTSSQFDLQAQASKEACEDATRGGHLTFADIMAEEFWEVMCEEDPALLEVELVQLVSVGVKWLQALRARREKHAHTSM